MQMQNYDLLVSPFSVMKDFVKVEVREPGAPTRTYTINNLHEVEYTADPWLWPVPALYVPDHHLCRRWAGESGAGCARVSGRSEWHATLFYEPQATPARSPAHLTVTVKIRPVRLEPDVTLVSHPRVFLASSPLPRFGENWLYGDLH